MRMTKLLILIASLMLLAGCGQDPTKAVYNTKANPEGYPARACLMLDQLESGQLATYDEITTNFGELYTSFPELLDNPQWQQLIERLGVKFRYRADQLVDSGVVRYREAGKLYILAAFARPLDERLQYRNAMFSTWEKAITDSIVSPGFDPTAVPVSVTDQLRILRYFLLDDSIHQDFAQEFLVPRILDRRAAEAAMKVVGPQQLPLIDKCFLATLGFKFRGPGQPMASFAEPPIDLMASQLSRQPNGWYHAEFYFIPRENLTAEYTVALRIAVPDTTAPVSPGRFRQLSLDFRPTISSKNWKPGELAPAYRRFAFPESPSQVAIGIYEKSADSAHFVPMRDTGEPIYILPGSVISSR
ncbi:MAG: hypothetical protein IPH75_11950 [bacterium]|nr:hypothetical protein [bacterium]